VAVSYLHVTADRRYSVKLHRIFTIAVWLTSSYTFIHITIHHVKYISILHWCKLQDGVVIAYLMRVFRCDYNSLHMAVRVATILQWIYEEGPGFPRIKSAFSKFLNNIFDHYHDPENEVSEIPNPVGHL
jgi:hypothetical protein